MTTERQAEQEWLEQVRAENLRRTDPLRRPVDLSRYGHGLYADPIGRYARNLGEPAKVSVPEDVLQRLRSRRESVERLDREAVRLGQWIGWGLSLFPGPPPCPVIGSYAMGAQKPGQPIDGVNSSTWSHSSRVRARVLPCLQCGKPARGLEPLCVYCADWHAIDKAIAGPPVRRPSLLVTLALSAGTALVTVAGWRLVAGWLS